MRLPKIGYTPEKAQREMVAMRGINWSDKLQDGDLRDSGNLSFRRWPCLTTRRGREKQKGYTGVTALTAHGKLVAVRGKDLLYDGKKVGTVSAGAKQFACVNTKLVIWPDKVYLDLESKTVKPLGVKLALSARSVRFEENSITTGYRPVLIHGVLPRDEEDDVDHSASVGPGMERFGYDYQDGGFWLYRFEKVSRSAAGWEYTGRTEVNLRDLRIGDLIELSSYNRPLTTNQSGSAHGTNYGRINQISVEGGYTMSYFISFDVIFCPLAGEDDLAAAGFKAGDSVTLTGAGGNSRSDIVIKTLDASTATFEGANFTPGNDAGRVTIERRVPELNFICESQNRLWGCEGHTIYASALGDPTNFFLYSGVSTDSYAVAVGTDGDFTGCIGYSEGVLFWKEDCLHKVLGTYPANYELHTYSIPGVQAGSGKSMAVINDLLFYKGERGVYAYGGGTPSLLSECFGQREFTQAVGGTDGERYYLSVKEGGAWHLLVYDPKVGMWLREDDTQARDFARLGNRLYFADGSGNVWLTDGGTEDREQEWTAQFAPLYETVGGRKRYSRLLLRLELPAGSWVRAELRLDNGPWNECGKAVGRTEDVVPMRLGVNRCDKLELRLRGKGPCAVLSILREFTVGSER